MLAESGLAPGQTVLELGAGPGFWTGALAQAVGPEGRVVAQDVQRPMLERLTRAARSFPRRDVVLPLLALSDDLPLGDASIDLVFAAFVLEEIEAEGLAASTAGELARVARDGATLAVREHRALVPVARFARIVRALEAAGFETEGVAISGFAYRALFHRRRRSTEARAAC